MSDKGKAAWFLALLSPLTAELLSGSAPPLEFFSLFGLTILVAMYGGGVLIVRELTVSWRKGWVTVILLGAAYGIIEEGIAVKSFFDPGWVDLGSLGEYGRYFEVNWVWSVWLTVYHSMISIALPILVLSIWSPWTKGARILSERQFQLVAILFVAVIAFCAVAFVFIQDYTPPPMQYALAFVVVVALVLLARRLPANLISARHGAPSWSRWRFLVLGFLTLTLSFIVSGMAYAPLHPIVPILLLLGLCTVTLFLLQHKLGASDNAVHKAYFAVGLLSLFIILGPFHEASGVFGMSAVSAAYVVFSLILIKKAESQKPDGSKASPLQKMMGLWRRRTGSNR